MYGSSYQRERPSMPVLRPSDTPVTLILIGGNLLTFLLTFFTQSDWLLRGLGLTDTSGRFPWTLVTWPLVSVSGIVALLCNCFWTWSIAGSQERAWGFRKFLGFTLTTTVITSIAALAWMLLFRSGPLGFFGGLSFAMAPITTAWCWINRRETILFNYLFPIPALWIAGLAVAFSYYFAANLLGSPFAGIVVLFSCGYALWYARGGAEVLAARFRRGGPVANARFADLDWDIRGGKPVRNPLQKAREAKEQRERDAKIAEMFRNSGYKDDER